MNRPILSEHKKLLTLIAKAEASKSRRDGYINSGPTLGWVHIGGQMIPTMKTNGWPPIINFAKDLAAHGLLEFYNEANDRTVRTTDAGKSFLMNGTTKITKQEHAPLNVSGLHPKVRAAACSLVRDGHYRQAIHDTLIALIEEVKSKTGLSIDGAPLMQKAFSKDSPLIDLGSGDKQLGHMWLFSGAVMGLRNVYSHSSKQETDPQRALEILAFVSYLFRTIDEAKSQSVEQ